MAIISSFIFRYHNLALEKLTILTRPKCVIVEANSQNDFLKINDFASKIFNLRPQLIQQLQVNNFINAFKEETYYFVTDLTFRLIADTLKEQFTTIDDYSLACGKLDINLLLYEDVIDYYTNYYPNLIEKWSNKNDHRIKFINDKYLLNQNILDLGCGDGGLTKSLTAKNNVFGVDISEILVKKAKTVGISAITLNLETELLPYPDEFFDLVIGCDIFEHLFNYNKLLKEIYRCIKKEGELFVSIPIGGAKRHKIMSGFFNNLKSNSNYYDGLIPDINIKSFVDTISIFESYGFIVEYVEGWEWPWKPTYKYRKEYLKNNPEDADDVFIRLKKITIINSDNL
ncbi:MAG: class I SAM-dependent methyltransferase [Bacteroidales bacterium]|jgi:SAM-dependent methyltransferase|nr:class I SAM-dependent methyltransferase [Bacteroidales bacterium]